MAFPVIIYVFVILLRVEVTIIQAPPQKGGIRDKRRTRFLNYSLFLLGKC